MNHYKTGSHSFHVRRQKIRVFSSEVQQEHRSSSLSCDGDWVVWLNVQERKRDRDKLTRRTSFTVSSWDWSTSSETWEQDESRQFLGFSRHSRRLSLLELHLSLRLFPLFVLFFTPLLSSPSAPIDFFLSLKKRLFSRVFHIIALFLSFLVSQKKSPADQTIDPHFVCTSFFFSFCVFWQEWPHQEVMMKRYSFQITFLSPQSSCHSL